MAEIVNAETSVESLRREYELDDKKRIFLAGPTPRSSDVESWRPKMVSLLSSFDGIIYVPEGNANPEKDEQINWEQKAMLISDIVVFWIPRDLQTLPGFTTNVEFGFLLKDDRAIFYGRPEGAPKTHYLDKMYDKYRANDFGPYDSMEEMAVDILEYMEKNFCYD